MAGKSSSPFAFYEEQRFVVKVATFAAPEARFNIRISRFIAGI